MSTDLQEFQNCLNLIEVGDICSSGLQFTWTKNLHRVKDGNQSGVLKKLDRVMANNEFLSKFPQCHAVLYTLHHIISLPCNNLYSS